MNNDGVKYVIMEKPNGTFYTATKTFDSFFDAVDYYEADTKRNSFIIEVVDGMPINAFGVRRSK